MGFAATSLIEAHLTGGSLGLPGASALVFFLTLSISTYNVLCLPPATLMYGCQMALDVHWIFMLSMQEPIAATLQLLFYFCSGKGSELTWFANF